MDSLAWFLTTVLSSGLIAAMIAPSFNEAKERWLLRRQKIEEIYLCAATWLNFANGHFLPYLDVCNGRLTYNQKLDIELKNADTEIGSHLLKTRMNIEMYERSLIPALQVVEQELKILVKILSEIRNCYDKTGQASEFLVPLTSQLLTFGKAGDALISAVAQRGAEIGAERGQFVQAFRRAYIMVKRCLNRVRLYIFVGETERNL